MDNRILLILLIKWLELEIYKPFFRNASKQLCVCELTCLFSIASSCHIIYKLDKTKIRKYSRT